MADVKISPAETLNGTLRLPGDKSISHRYAILAGLAEGASEIHNYSSGADCQSTLGAMQSMGVTIERKGADVVILTGAVVVLPLLFMGSLITESFFGIPGLGSYTIDAIQAQDFAVVRAMVFLGSFLYIVGLILTDISYSWADPRVRLQ